jgi:hypothetical protein
MPRPVSIVAVNWPMSAAVVAAVVDFSRSSSSPPPAQQRADAVDGAAGQRREAADAHQVFVGAGVHGQRFGTDGLYVHRIGVVAGRDRGTAAVDCSVTVSAPPFVATSVSPEWVDCTVIVSAPSPVARSRVSKPS